MPAPLSVRPVTSRREERAFLELPYRLHRDDPLWVPPLRTGERRRWDPKHNATLRRIQVARFVAWSRERAVGRVAVSFDPRFQRWSPGSGFFGFFESDTEPGIAEALFQSVETQLRGWGCTRVLGPVNQSTHEEVGLLVEGFNSRPALLTPYAPAWHQAVFESMGWEGVRDYLAFEWTPEAQASPGVRRIAASMGTELERYGDYSFRSLDPRNFDREVQTLGELYNLAFRDVWGFVELDRQEFRERAEAFRPFHDPRLISIVSLRGRDVGFSVILPDVNVALAGLGGRLFPLGWLHLMRRLPRIRSARFILMGVVPEATGRGLGPALSLYLRDRVVAADLERVEVSMVQGDNASMIRVVEALGCRRTKTYRLLGKDL